MARRGNIATQGRGGGGRRRPGRRQTPQPPAPQPPAGPPQMQPGSFEYSPTVSQQLDQPYQDMLMGGAVASLPGVFGRMGQQGQMADIYSQGAAQNLGGAAQGMQGLSQLGGQAMGQGSQYLSDAYGSMGGVGQFGNQATGLGQGTLGQYGSLMDPNLAIQQNLARQIQAIQSGADKGFDPLLDQQLGDQERVLKEQMRRQLGGDYANSSAGIEALSKFNQSANLQRGTSRFNQLQGLLGQQQAGLGNLAQQGLGFGGAGQGVAGQQFGQGIQAGQFGAGIQGQQFGQGQALGGMFGNQSGQLYDQAMGIGAAGQNAQQAYLNRLGQMQQLYGNIPQTMAQFGQAMSGQAGAAVGAQGPYQQDRFGQFQASQFPSQGQFMGQMMGQSGDRWIQAANSMGGSGGGGGGGMGGMSGGFNQFGGAAGTGQGDPNWASNWDMAG